MVRQADRTSEDLAVSERRPLAAAVGDARAKRMLAGHAHESAMGRQRLTLDGQVGRKSLHGLDRLAGADIRRQGRTERHLHRMGTFDWRPKDESLAFEVKQTAPALVHTD